MNENLGPNEPPPGLPGTATVQMPCDQHALGQPDLVISAIHLAERIGNVVSASRLPLIQRGCAVLSRRAPRKWGRPRVFGVVKHYTDSRYLESFATYSPQVETAP